MCMKQVPSRCFGAQVSLAFGSIALVGATACAQSCGEWVFRAEAGPSLRERHSMAFDSARGVTVLFGGWHGDVLGDTWEWNGVVWTRVSTSGPQPRNWHAMVYDSARGVVVLFGGRDGAAQPLGDTWEWNGSEWTEVATTGPSARSSHSMAYDSGRGVTVLFGGVSQSDTWEWNGVDWIRVATSGPSTRFGHAMAYDSNRGVTVLFGGSPASRQYLDDTWEWDGSLWREVNAAGPPARSNHAIVFDNSRGVAILFGGSAAPPRFGDTWEWNGLQWTQVASTGAPPRTNHGMAYDSLRGATVVFGGWDSQTFNDTWEWQYNFWFVEHPQDVVVRPGEGATFATSVNGWGGWTYQWRRNGAPLQDGGTISGSRTSRLAISRVFPSDRGGYDCIVRDHCGEIASREATLYVVDPALEVASTCPDGGPIIVSWQHASPQGQVALIFSLGTGRFSIPQGFPCEGTRLGLAPNQIQVAWQGSAGVDGSRTINGSAGPNACGGYLQLLDLAACETSNVARIE